MGADVEDDHGAWAIVWAVVQAIVMVAFVLFYVFLAVAGLWLFLGISLVLLAVLYLVLAVQYLATHRRGS